MRYGNYLEDSTNTTESLVEDFELFYPQFRNSIKGIPLPGDGTPVRIGWYIEWD